MKSFRQAHYVMARENHTYVARADQHMAMHARGTSFTILHHMQSNQDAITKKQHARKEVQQTKLASHSKAAHAARCARACAHVCVHVRVHTCACMCMCVGGAQGVVRRARNSHRSVCENQLTQVRTAMTLLAGPNETRPSAMALAEPAAPGDRVNLAMLLQSGAQAVPPTLKFQTVLHVQIFRTQKKKSLYSDIYIILMTVTYTF